MSCKRYQRLLHLNRSGEISQREADDLRQHLRLCEKCSLEFQRIQRADGFVGRLSSVSPSPVDPEKLTADILRRVRAEASSPRPLNPLDQVVEIFMRPVIRFATVVIVLVITTTFAVQLVGTVNDVYALERRMETSRRDIASSTSGYSVQSKTLQEVVKSERANTLTSNASFNVRDGRIQIPEKDVESLLSAYSLKNLSTLVGSAALHVDKKTLEKIVNEVKATAERSFRLGHEGG
jgi:anti-sigma factor RsiW